MQFFLSINSTEGSRRYSASLLVLLFILTGLPQYAFPSVSLEKDVSWQQTVSLYQRVPCLTRDQLDYGKEIIRGLNYNSRRVFRKICLMEGVTFAKTQEAWTLLLYNRLSFEQVLSFEAWCSLDKVDIELGLSAITKIQSLGYEASRSFRKYLTLSDISPQYVLKTIPLLNNFDDAHNRALQSFLTLRDLDVDQAHIGLGLLGRLQDNQVRAAESFAAVAGMNSETILDGLRLLKTLHQDDAWNARSLFHNGSVAWKEAWDWLVGYFALPPAIQEVQYTRLQDDDKRVLLQGLHDGGEMLIWKINNLHAVTDRFGFEVAASTLRSSSPKQLEHRFNSLSTKIVYSYSDRFYAAKSKGDKNTMIAILRRATAKDRIQTAQDLTSANIYILLAQGSELYDSSFRDILVPLLHKRIKSAHNDDLLEFLQATDPDNRFVADFIVSCAQKGKLTTFFPKDSNRQKEILSLVATSAFRDEDSILLFSATLVHLLKVLEPEARSFLITTMGSKTEGGSMVFSRLINVILQYAMKEYPQLLNHNDRTLIARLSIHHGAVNLNQYGITPFAEWKSDNLLGSVSVFHPDDDGRQSFYSNARLLQKNGYRLSLSSQYTLAPITAALQSQSRQSISAARVNPAQGLPGLFRAMEKKQFSVAFVKETNGLLIRHSQVIYSDKVSQQEILGRFIRSGDEMLAQRGHSYWRSEQIVEPLEELINQSQISKSELESKQRFLSLGSCGGVKAYTKLSRMFYGSVDILATIGTGLASINDPYNKNFFEVVATHAATLSWKNIEQQSAHIFQGGKGRDYLHPGSLTAILHKILDEEKDFTPLDGAHVQSNPEET